MDVVKIFRKQAEVRYWSAVFLSLCECALRAVVACIKIHCKAAAELIQYFPSDMQSALKCLQKVENDWFETFYVDFLFFDAYFVGA